MCEELTRSECHQRGVRKMFTLVPFFFHVFQGFMSTINLDKNCITIFETLFDICISYVIFTVSVSIKTS